MGSDPGVERTLDERPDLAEPLEAVLAVDERRDRWTFDDVPIGSGDFGELVSRGVVESAGNQYRLADAEAVRRSLSADADGTRAESEDDPAEEGASAPVTLPRFDRTTWLLVVAAMAVVGLVRALPLASVYRDGHVVLSGNDPYHYRHEVEEAIGAGGLPESALDGEPLFVATLTAFAEVLGGTVAAVSHVLAWYPVVAAVLGAGIVYLLAMSVTEDRRIALAAVLFFALLPDHAARTSVGFADHHAFDYLWLGLTALAVTKLATVERDDLATTRTWLLALVVALAVAGQVLAWDAGTLLVAPVALVVSARTALDVHRGVSPLPLGVTLVAGLGLGAAVAFVVHLATGMQETVTVLSPAVLALWSALALVMGIGAHRLDWRPGSVIAGYGVLGAVGLIGFVNSPAPVRRVVFAELSNLFRTGAITETQSILNPDSFGFLFHLGLTLVVALPAMVVAIDRSIADDRWLPATSYAWYFLALALLQVRFVGELAAFVALFAGCSFVWAAARLDALSLGRKDTEGRTSLHVPDRRAVATLIVLFVLLGGFGAVQSKALMDRTVVEDRVYDTATFLADHAEERGQPYPENYVLSDWSDNRVYNYLVSGESASYLYAQENYTDFAGGTDPDGWYETFDGRVGYVVLAPAQDGVDPRSTIWRLTRTFGSRDDGVPGVAHYRPLYIPDDAGRLAVAVVPGATLRGTAEPGARVTVSTVVDRPTVEFRYERQTRAGEDGTWRVTVANPGEYDVKTGNRSTTVEVSERAVRNGEGVGSD